MSKKKYNYHWGFGIEHETHFVKMESTDKLIKSYNIIDLEEILQSILFNWEDIKLKLKKYKISINKSEEIYRLLEDILIRKFENTGRKCNGKYVLKPLHTKNNNLIKMPEFVTSQPFSRTKKKKSIEDYCEEIQNQQRIFQFIINLYLSIYRKKKYIIYPFPFGMSNYFMIDDIKQKDYSGSFHITVTLPYTLKTTEEKFVNNHKNFANQFQWLEPLLISVFFSGDDDAIGNNKRKIKGSFRVTSVGWGNFAGSDVRKFNEGIGRLTNHNYNWRNNMDYFQKEKTNYCKKVSPGILKREPNAKSGFSSDFRTFGGKEHVSGYPMEKPSGTEIRIFDNIHTDYTIELCRLIVYIAENSRNNSCNNYVYNDKDWNENLQNIMMNGWKTKITKKYLNKLRENLNLKINTKSLISYDVMMKINNELFEKNKDGLWSNFLLKKKYKKPPSLKCVNRYNLENGYLLKLQNNKNLLKKFKEFYINLDDNISYEEFSKLFIKNFGKSYQNDIDDIMFLYESLFLININKNNIKKTNNDFKFKTSEINLHLLDRLLYSNKDFFMKINQE